MTGGGGLKVLALKEDGDACSVAVRDILNAWKRPLCKRGSTALLKDARREQVVSLI